MYKLIMRMLAMATYFKRLKFKLVFNITSNNNTFDQKYNKLCFWNKNKSAYLLKPNYQPFAYSRVCKRK